ncbi:DUF1801 domain-containing protein [Chryseobacterium daecheongense]|uniref:DUF1801 domain-containing protein n=1 Tax=Chryseobacterium daecheongense TaxID=192389 RepID=UPI001FD6ED0F|nr:DUF1801 domain-containing protein [Chryseobacterium daecheongense]UOU98918.1 DUF1801 domain-containing protein [Chryseobacterium daecheongense]
MKTLNRNEEVTRFLDALKHPLRDEIELLRSILLSEQDLEENIKWNGPNYSLHTEDRITMKIQPSKQIQLIFHRGAKKLEQPRTQLIDDNSRLLTWKENDRAFASFKNVQEIENSTSNLKAIIQKWISATK